MYLTGKGQMLPLFEAIAAYAMNTMITISIRLSPFKLDFAHKPPDPLNLAFLLLQQFANNHNNYL